MVKARLWNNDYVYIDFNKENIKYTIIKNDNTAESEREMTQKEIKEFLLHII